MRKEKKVRMPHNFHLSMSVSWTIKSKEHAGCYSKFKKKNFLIFYSRKILDFEHSSLKTNLNVTFNRNILEVEYL